MASETDSSSSLSLPKQERKHKKLAKKLKRKSEKKHKKEKKRNREKKDSRKTLRQDYGERNGTKNHKTILPQTKFEENASNTVFGPALPPDLLNKNKEVENNKAAAIGPFFPMGHLEHTKESNSQNFQEVTVCKDSGNLCKSEIDNSEVTYGPVPISNNLEMTPAQLKLEQRALQLKMAAIDGISVPTSNQKVREEWMLELPTVGLKSGLAALNNLKRGFHQGKEKPDFSDRSSWTKTPNSSEEKQKPTSLKEDLELQAQTFYEKQHDAEQEAIAKKDKKKHKRDESLVEIHQKKLRKEEKRKAKELKESGAKPERRPFTRDVDLKLNKIDRNQTKQIVDKAKILNTKFSSGHSKYL